MAHFGYQSNEKATVEIPVGALNSISPSPLDRGQPTLFKPGSYRNVFTAVVPAASGGVWTLSSAQATASAKTAVCEGNLDVCTTVNIKEILTVLDQIAKAQLDLVKAIASAIRKQNPSAKVRRAVDDMVAEANALYVQQWTLIWTKFPPQVLVCAVGCQTTSLTPNISLLNSGSQEMVAIANRGIKLLARSNSRIAPKVLARRRTEVRKRNESFQQNSAKLPQSESKC